MQDLPQKALRFLILIYLLGLLALLSRFPAVLARDFVTGAHLWELALFVALAGLAGGKKVYLLRNQAYRAAGNMSLLFPIVFATMLRLGPGAGMLALAAGCLTAGLFPKRQAAHQTLFNVALGFLQVFFAGAIFLWLNGGSLHLSLIRSFPGVVAACLIYFAINTGGVATIIALCTARPPAEVWRQSFLWTAPSYFAGACISALALLIFGSQLGIAVAFVSPVAYLIYQSYATYTARAEEKQQHINDLQASQANLADLYLATIKSLALAIDAKDQYTSQHILRVQRYAVATGIRMGLTGNELEGLNTGALLHDIGKLGVPESVLLKPGRLTEEEFAKVKQHPQIGAAILGPVDFPWPVLPVVRSHHERWDGTGYPDGLKGEEIPLAARILAVADVYDALTSTRSYRKAWTHERTVETIIQDAGTHLDPNVVFAFLEVIDGVVAALAQESQAQGEGPMDGAQDTKVQAKQAAQAISRASSELWALYEVVQTLSSSLGLQDTLEILGRKMEAILPGTTCLFLLKEGEGRMVVRTAVGVNWEFFQDARTLSAASQSLVVAARRETYLGEYDVDDLLPVGPAAAFWEMLRSALIVPIVHQGEVLGTINVYHAQADAFTIHDRHLLETIAERAAMALYNGLLFDRTRSRASTDPLTGLFNVRHLTEHVENHCQRPDALDWPFALLCLDLDSFKPINDNFGHQKGDQVLRDLSALFQAAVREADVVARYGGDEFLIVLHGAGPAEADAMAQRLQEIVLGYDPGLFHERLGNLSLGVSIGFGCFPQDGLDCAALLSAADGQMYHNKAERKLGILAGRDHLSIAERTSYVLPPDVFSKAA